MEPDAVTGRHHTPKFPWTSWKLTPEKNPTGKRHDLSKDNAILKHNSSVQRFLNTWDWVLVAIQPCQQWVFSDEPTLNVIIQGICVYIMVSTRRSKAQLLLHSPSGFTHLSKSRVPWDLQAEVCLHPGVFKLSYNLLKSFVLQLLIWHVWSVDLNLGFPFGKREKPEVQSSCSRAVELALQEATPGTFRKAVPKDPCKAWRPGRTYSSIVLASYQTTTLGTKACCVFKRWVLFVERIKYL